MSSRIGELILILLIILVLFGAGRLPQVISQLTKELNNIKRKKSSKNRKSSSKSEIKSLRN